MAARLKNKFKQKGFTLMELIAAIFIFSIIVVGIVSVFVSSASSYQKSQAIKSLKENIEYAMNSIAKDVRMGKVIATSGYSDGSPQSRLILSRNTGGNVCYEIGSNYLGIDESTGNCTVANIKKIVDLDSSGMTFDTDSAFYSCPSTFGTPSICPASSGSFNRRGWVEINLNIEPTAGNEMKADQINVQTIVSSRDYGWENVTP